VSSEVIRGWLARREYAEKNAQRHAAALCIQTGKEREVNGRRESIGEVLFVQYLTMMLSNNHWIFAKPGQVNTIKLIPGQGD